VARVHCALNLGKRRVYTAHCGTVLGTGQQGMVIPGMVRRAAATAGLEPI
jgi:hypothetical protein